MAHFRSRLHRGNQRISILWKHANDTSDPRGAAIPDSVPCEHAHPGCDTFVQVSNLGSAEVKVSPRLFHGDLQELDVPRVVELRDGYQEVRFSRTRVLVIREATSCSRSRSVSPSL